MDESCCAPIRIIVRQLAFIVPSSPLLTLNFQSKRIESLGAKKLPLGF